MTYAEALKRTGIKVSYTDQYETYEFKGETPNGKPFSMHKAGGAFGEKFTLYIDGQRMATACVYRTAVRLIKSN